MLSGRTDERWIVATRRWTLAAWMFLGVGQLLGSHWAYVEVGWGGYYAWDPVENAALMPWLAATAFLHSVMVQERKGMLKIWNMVLVTLAFELSILGTFLTRSGVINSIHSFAKSSIGAWFLFFLVTTALFSTALILWRLPLLRAKTKLESPLSREATFLYNNLLLVALCLTILWGVIFPILTDLFLDQTRTIGRPYFDFFLRAFGIPLLLLMGIGPLIAWRRSSVRGLLKTLRWPIGVALVTGTVLLVPRRRLVEARPDRVQLLRVRADDDRGRARARDARDRVAVRAHLAKPAPLRRLRRPRLDRAARDRHRRLQLVLVGEGRPAPARAVGDGRRPHGHLRRPRAEQELERERDARRDVDLGRERPFGAARAARSEPASTTTSTATRHVRSGIHTNWLRAEDTYIIFDQQSGNTVFFKVLVKPLVNLIWLAGIVFLLGSLVALWPDAREQRRLVARLALART